jgi:hypothetical protein
MRFIILFSFCLTSLFGSSQSVEKTALKPDAKSLECFKGKMNRAWYEHGTDDSIPNISGLAEEFIILVDTAYKSRNFISYDEEYNRLCSASLDTSDFTWIHNWDKLTNRQKLKKMRQEKSASKTQADSIHLLNNQGQQQVWIVNNSKNPITIQMQDWSYVCILEALNSSGQWHAIEYWQFSNCGNSYHYKKFLPKSANSFITSLPSKGDYKTKLRYKLLGKDKFYYSNEFQGKINHCQFVEDIADCRRHQGKAVPNYKLDTLINLVRN